MGGSSPTVFHTAPPHPASKARWTLYSLSVGGAEASQNGFGLAMPTKLVVRSAMLRLLVPGGLARGAPRSAQPSIGGDRGALAVLDRLDREVAASVGAVAARPDLRVRRAPLLVGGDSSALQGDRGPGRARFAYLADGLEDHVGRQDEGLAGLDQLAALGTRVRKAHSAHLAAFRENFPGRRPMLDGHP